MSVSTSASAAAERRGSRFDPIDILTSIVFVVATIIWTIAVGKDLNWDQLNYHFYTAYSLLEGRIDQDFMAASGQSTLNSLAYVPFYWMVSQGWHSILIASVLGAFHALNIVFAYLICRTVLTESGLEKPQVIAALGAALAFLSPIFL